MGRGFIYLITFIDWHSRKILFWRVSNTREVFFCAEVLRETIENYETIEYFNTDQGSWFTSNAFTSINFKFNILENLSFFCLLFLKFFPYSSKQVFQGSCICSRFFLYIFHALMVSVPVIVANGSNISHSLIQQVSQVSLETS